MKRKLFSILFILVLVLGFSTNSYAQSEKEKKEDEVKVPDLATEESSSKGTVYENVDEKGDDFKVKGLDENGKIVEISRQFISFKTKSGKTLHIIVDHSKKTDNVMLLTEVSELDLLNMVEMKDKEKLKPKSLLLDDDKETKKVEEKPKLKEEVKEPEKKSNNSIIFIVLIMLVVGGAGYYFKVYKPKNDNPVDEYDSEDDAEVSDDYFFENDSEDSETTENTEE